MKKKLLLLNVLAFALMLLAPIHTWAIDPASNLSASLVNGNPQVSFTKSTGTSGYMLLRKQGSIVPSLLNLPTIVSGLTYQVGAVVSGLNGWEVVTSTTNLTAPLELNQGYATYLLYMRDANNNYSSPKSIFVNATTNFSFGSTQTHDLHIVSGNVTGDVFKASAVAINQSLVILRGTLLIKDNLEISGFLKVAQGVTIDNKTGWNSLRIKPKAKFELATYYPLNGLHSFHIEKEGVMDMLPGASIETSDDSGIINWMDGAIVNVYESDINIYARSNKVTIHSNAVLTFYSGGILRIYSDLAIPKATWNAGSSLFYYGSSTMEILSKGFDQEFHNLTWSTGANRVANKLMPDPGIKKIHGNFTIENTSGKVLSLEKTGTILIGGKLSIPAATTVVLSKSTTINGAFDNNGTVSFFDSGDALSVGGTLTNSNAASIILPKNTTISGDLLNAGTINADRDLLDVAGKLDNLANASLLLPKVTNIQGDFISLGAVTLNNQLNLKGSFEAGAGSGFKAEASNEVFFKTIAADKVSTFSFPTGLPASGAFRKVVIEPGRKITLGSGIELGGSGVFTVSVNATLDLGEFAVRKVTGVTGTIFTLSDNATIKIGHAKGLNADGAIQTDSKTLSALATYSYTGSAAQVTGSALPGSLLKPLVFSNPVSVTLTQDLSLTSTLTVSKGSLILNGKALAVQGNLTLGNTASLIGSSTSSLNLSGDINSALPALTLGSLEVKVATPLNLAGNLTIHQTLNLKGGMLNTKAFKIILLPSSTIFEAGKDVADGFVMGTIETERDTPLKNTDYAFGGIGLVINYKGIAGGSTKVQRITGEIYSSTKKELLANRIFKVSTTETRAGLNASIVFQYFKHELKPLQMLEEPNMMLYRSSDNGTSYVKIAGSVIDVKKSTITLSGIDKFNASATDLTQGAVAGFKQVVMPTGLTPKTMGLSFSKSSNAVTPLEETRPATIGAGNPNPDNNAPLPVELVKFTARLSADGAADLTWATASESDNSHFEVQRSEDGKSWNTVNQVKGQGTSSQLTNYSFTDRSFMTIAGPVAYYRLKQVDTDGTFEYSKIVALEQTNAKAQISNLSFNPGTGNLELRYTNLDMAQPMQVVVADLNGRILVSQRFKLDARSGIISIPVASSVKGVLVAKAAAGNTYVSGKFIK